MTSNVINLRPAYDPDNLLEKAVGQYESVLVIGYDKDGALDVRASLNITVAEINFMLDVFKAQLLSGKYSDEVDLG